MRVDAWSWWALSGVAATAGVDDGDDRGERWLAEADRSHRTAQASGAARAIETTDSPIDQATEPTEARKPPNRPADQSTGATRRRSYRHNPIGQATVRR